MDFKKLMKLCDGVPASYLSKSTLSQLYSKSFAPWFEAYKLGDQEILDNLKGMKENGLSEEEAFLVLIYTASSSSWINEEMREGISVDCDCKSSIIRNLDNVLAKIKSHDNKVVYRMDNPLGDNAKVLSWFSKAVTLKFTVPNFLSTSMENYENSPIIWKINTLVEGSMGKDISNLTNNKHEKEVLFRKDSCFEILEVDFEAAMISLNEVKSNDDISFKLTGHYFEVPLQ
jgi:hypothetical protein